MEWDSIMRDGPWVGAIILDWRIETIRRMDEGCDRITLPDLLRKNVPVKTIKHRGTAKEGTTIEQIVRNVSEKMGMSIVAVEDPGNVRSEANVVLVANDSVAMRVMYPCWPPPLSSLGLFSVTGTFEAAKELHGLIVEATDEPKPKAKRGSGRFFMLTLRRGVFQFRRIGEAGASFQPNNYPKDVADAFDPMAAWLRASSPHGRLVLFTGPPGTGKTYFLRGLMGTVDTVRWVFVPPGMVGDLANPAMMEALAEFHREDNDEDEDEDEPRPIHENPRSIVLVVEDADSLLVERKLANMAELSTLLNMTDGLVGTALDLRVIATCNGKIGAMDPAVLRNGRLQRKVDFELLPGDRVAALLRKLGEDWTPPNDTDYMALADVYARARRKEGDK